MATIQPSVARPELVAGRTCPRCGARYAVDTLFCPADGTALACVGGSATLVGELVAGQYLIEGRLGEGGMGTVYRAVQVRMARPCALKVLRRDVASDPATVARFRREASNSARFAHPNVAALYDFGETADGLFYLAMELVEGPTLATLLARGGALPPARAAAIIRQVGEALAAADDHGVVHRDLKPDNVLVMTRRDGSDLAKVVDFGVAKTTRVHGQTITRTGFIVGTPAYVSPEQLAGETDLDGRSDQYSLALIAFELLTGMRAFPAGTFGEAAQRLVAPAPRLAAARRDVEWPAAVQAVLDRALDVDRERRWPSSNAFGAALVDACEAWGGLSTPALGARAIPLHASAAPRRPLTVAVAIGGLALALVAVAGALLLPRGTAVDAPPPTPASSAAPAREAPRASTATVSLSQDAIEARVPRRSVPAATTPAVSDAPAAAEAPPAETPPIPAPPAAEAPPATDPAARAELDRLRALAQRDVLGQAEARAGVAAGRALLARLATPVDSVEGALYAAEIAYAHLEDTDTACALLRGVERQAAGTAFARAVAAYLGAGSPLQCR